MIRLVPDPTFETVVRMTVPGQCEPAEVPMTFRHMTAKQAADWFAASKEKPSAEALADIVCGWCGVMGEDGAELPFTPESLAALVKNYQPAAREIVRAWQLGLTESRVKN
ncbi:hypothetical protein COW64_12355 [bacterium (Candidatus Blackallbacteria) CG18_big_fil_WC_8_21_14_2_50_49_26]|nr:MAG: hypothetical protein COW64_12355 [bacterium (Candidatus Blackallbacteria) CG18_big_fil_WC_8_21_14_2_50_49_26]